MTMVLECGRVFPGCEFVVHGDSEEELMMKEIDHARASHEVEHLSEQLKARIRAAVQQE